MAHNREEEQNSADLFHSLYFFFETMSDSRQNRKDIS
nr:MAG TPA: late expression factor 5 [Caudoviricetes sp.]